MKLNSLKDTQNLSKKISKIINAGDIIFLYGEIGVGKTTFVRFLINQLEEINGLNKSHILSPTFNIIYDYDVNTLKVLHYDLYRLKSYKDILELGIFENSKENIKIIEWPKLIEKKPENRIEFHFKYSTQSNNRTVRIVGLGKWKGYEFDKIK